MKPSTPTLPYPAPPPDLELRLAEANRLERQQALRALLQRPLLRAGGDDQTLVLVRRHAVWLRHWLHRNPGWSLIVDSELARLRKTAVQDPDPEVDSTGHSRPATDPVSGTPFSRRRYVLLCLALAALERCERQTTLGKVADSIVTLSAADPELEPAGMAFTLQGRDQRRDLVQVVRLLLDLRVLTRVHGSEEQYLAQSGDVLYNISRPALAAMLSLGRGPSTLDAAVTTTDQRIAAITAEPLPDTDAGRNRGLRSRLYRRLLDDPVLYFAELAPEELAYLRSQRGQIAAQITEASGLIPEIRSEGMAMVDDRGDLTDIKLPEEGTDGHLTLLLAEYLAEQARHQPGAISLTRVRRHTATLITEHRRRWRKDVTEPGAEVRLSERTLDRLAALNLVRRTSDGVIPLPAIARFALAAVIGPPVQGSLWSESDQ